MDTNECALCLKETHNPVLCIDCLNLQTKEARSKVDGLRIILAVQFSLMLAVVLGLYSSFVLHQNGFLAGILLWVILGVLFHYAFTNVFFLRDLVDTTVRKNLYRLSLEESQRSQE